VRKNRLRRNRITGGNELHKPVLFWRHLNSGVHCSEEIVILYRHDCEKWSMIIGYDDGPSFLLHFWW
jgi:hypothetical protein